MINKNIRDCTLSQTSVCRNITKDLYAAHEHLLDHEAFSRKIVTISQESFYHPLNKQDQQKAKLGQYNFDHPGQFSKDFELFDIVGKRLDI